MPSTGILYIVATPIGNLEDLSPRAIQTLGLVDYIAAEDTRHSRSLLQHFNINKPCISLHEHNEQQKVDRLLTDLQNGQSIALISDAGTPLISDPGYRLVHAARKNNIKIIPIPGPCALITALCASGLPANRFAFEGFLPAKTAARKKYLQSLLHETRTLIFYESSHRILDALSDMITIFGEQREAVLARELTKIFETIINDSLLQLKNRLESDPNQQKGEFVIIIQGSDSNLDPDVAESEKILKVLLKELPVSQAVKLTATITDHKKSELYSLALRIKEQEQS